jgi:ATP-dependent helicase HrpB
VVESFVLQPDLSLPIDRFIDQIVAAARRSRAVVVTAAPGAGKTTRVPPALVADGPVILLQPRRVAARAIAARIAAEGAARGWTLGREVGWQIRFERHFSAATQLLVVTEGVLTARLQGDPLLSDFRTIVLDEFHERSIHADLAIALARQAWRARDDLRLVVMSATLDSAAVSAFLDGCPVVDVPGRLHPIEVVYAPGLSVADAAADVVRSAGGDVLCFLPGAPEIRRTIGDLQSRLPGGDVEILPLHGSLDADEQDAALRASSRRRIIVATNIAETSLTVPGVTAVVDSGLHKVARYDADRGIDSLETERITADAADQRAGRAGRTAPGVVRRLWDARDRLRPHREPEIHRVDLSSTVLDVIAWGGDPRTLEWFEPPRADAIDAALTLLARLGVIDGRGLGVIDARSAKALAERSPLRLTEIGKQVRRLPLHPRLARMLVASGGARSVAQACALLSERHLLPPRTATTSSDLLSAIDDPLPRRIEDLGLRIADLFTQSILNKSAIRNPQSAMTEMEFRRAVLAGYPDRVAQRREPGSANVRLASGTGATIAPESGVRDGEFLVALDVSDIVNDVGSGRRAALSGPPRGGTKSPVRRAPEQARIRIASRVEREWLTPTATDIVHRFDQQSGSVKALRVERYDALVLSERPIAADPEIAAARLADEWKGRNRSEDDARLLRRLRFAGQAIDLDDLIRTAAYGARSLDDVDLARGLGANVIRDLDRDAPDTLLVPSGRRARIDYNEDGTVSASVKLQELFGLADTPRIGRRRAPLLLALLAPNGRPVQLTRDLRSFWDRTYPEVKKELRGRYPKHPWPDDPWNATPTARTTRRGKKV